HHDRTVDPGPSDTVPGKFRWGRELSLRALTRVLELDPSFYLAFRHILDILRGGEAFGCVRRAANGDCGDWRAVVLRRGDSLLIQPVLMSANRAGYFRQVNQAARQRPTLANLERARKIAENSVAADSMSGPARIGLASALV